MSAIVSNYLAFFFTLCIFSLVLYKDNKLFRVAETVLVGITAANGIVLNYHDYVRPSILIDIGKDGKWWYVIPILLGLLIYARHVRSISWWSRIPMGLWLGIGAGYILARTPGVFISQIQATFMSLDTVNSVVFVVGVVTVLGYFLFTTPTDKGVMKGVSGAGKLFLLVGFGAAFANTVMTRISVLLGRMQFIFHDILRIGK